MARPERFELPTTWFEARYSIQLSYGRIVRYGVRQSVLSRHKSLSPAMRAPTFATLIVPAEVASNARSYRIGPSSVARNARSYRIVPRPVARNAGTNRNVRRRDDRGGIVTGRTHRGQSLKSEDESIRPGCVFASVSHADAGASCDRH